MIQTQTPTLRVDDTDGFVWHRKFQVFRVINGVTEGTVLWGLTTTGRTRAVTTAVLPAGATYEWRAASFGSYNAECTAYTTPQRFTIADPPALPLSQTVGSGCDEALASTGCETESAGSGDPAVDGQNAGLAESSSDMSLEGRGVAFSVSRSYASVDPTIGRFGAGWAFNLGVGLRIFLNGDVEVRGETGQAVTYVKKTDGTFTIPAGANSVLAAVSGGYTLTTPDKQRYSFNTQGMLTQVVDRVGQGLTLAYNTANDLISVTNAEGKVVTVTTNPTTHLVTGFTMPAGDGRSVTYAYLPDGRMNTVTDMSGNITTYRYDAVGRLDGVKEQVVGTTERWRTRVVFNPNGQVVSSQDGEGNTTTYSWSGSAAGMPLNGVKTITAPRGGVSTETYNDGLLVATKDANNFTETFSYDADMNLVRQTDKAGNATTMTYDAAGNMLTKTSPGPTARKEVWTYDAATNNMLTYKNARGFTTTYAYYTTGTSAGLLWKETDAKAGVTEYTWRAPVCGSSGYESWCCCSLLVRPRRQARTCRSSPRRSRATPRPDPAAASLPTTTATLSTT